MRRPPAPAQPEAGGKDFIENLNVNGIPLPDQKLEFERHGYFVADRVDHVQRAKPVFNLAVGLKDSWGNGRFIFCVRCSNWRNAFLSMEIVQ